MTLDSRARYIQSEVTIAVGASKSDFIETLGYRLVGVLVPASCEGNGLKFFADIQGADDTGAIVYNQAGEEIRAVYGTLPCVIDLTTPTGTNRGKLPPAARYAVQSHTNGTAEPQVTADSIITLILELIEG